MSRKGMFLALVFTLSAAFGILGSSQPADADTYAVITNHTNAPVAWKNSRFSGTIEPGGYLWTWLPNDLQVGGKAVKIFDAGKQCGSYHWVISGQSPAGRVDTCVLIYPAQVGCVGVDLQANGRVKLGQVPTTVCSNTWNNQAGFNSPQAHEAYRIILQVLGAIAESI